MPDLGLTCPTVTDSVVIPVTELISVRQASRQFGIPTRTLYRWLAQGKLTRLDVAGRTFIHTAELEQAS